MLRKIGRNEPCWCGSGKKHKKCHLGREKEPSPNRQEMITGILGPLEGRYCLHPEAGKGTCSGQIIKAHTIQRGGGLQRIARNGHVYALRGNLFSPEEFRLEPKLIGIRQASTFTGFCSKHDNDTFQLIEKNPFLSCSEHAFLLGYRALCREVYGKRALKQSLDYQRTLDRGRPLTEQLAIQEALQRFGIGFDLGSRDAESYKAIYDEVILSDDYSQANYYIIELQDTPQILCSACQFPSYDFNGNKLQDFTSRERLDMVAFSVISTDQGGAIVFNWIGESSPVNRLILSLDSLHDSEISSAIVRYAFEFFENVYFSPDWWESLDEEVRHKLCSRSDAAFRANVQRRHDCLVDDGYRPVAWQISSRHMQL